MSPRNERYTTPKWRVKAIRDQRKSILHGPYDCPKCNLKNMQITLEPTNKKAFAECNCGFQTTLQYFPNFEAVDYYSKILDQNRKSSQF